MTAVHIKNSLALRVVQSMVLGLCGLLTPLGFAQAQETARYTVLIMEKPAGAQTTALKPDGVREYAFEFNDRGRGPKLTSRYKFDNEGFPVSLETAGNDYLKTPVSESLTVADGVARWRSPAENGEKKLTGRAFYLSIYGPPEELAMLARALLKSPNKRLPLLPEGEASISRTGELAVQSGEKTRRVISYEVSGLGFSPTTIWLDEDNTFFASVSSWFSFVREGWESTAPVLLKKQNELEAGRSTQLARTLIRKPSTPLAIINANLFDSDSGRTVPNVTVIVEGNRIKSVGQSNQISIPKNAERIDARGRTLMPGLWDMHVHIGPTDGLMHLAAGVTSVRDLANDTDALLALKRKFETNEDIGPRVFMSGFMDGRGPYAGPTKVFVDTEEEARAAIDNYAKLGYSGIKIYSSIKPELVPHIIELAHAKGLRVSGHVPAFMTAEQFIKAGADELQHVNFVFLNFLFDEVKDTRTPARFTTVAEHAATMDLNSERVATFIRLLKEKRIVVDPTVTVFFGMFVDRPGKPSVAFEQITDRLPPQVRRSFVGGGLPVPEGKDELYRQSARALLKMVKLLYDSGVQIVAGTDSVPGFGLHRELEMYVEAGIPPAEVLKLATIGAARVVKRDAELGSIAPGKLADLILVNGNPARQISDIRRVSMVIKDGNIYDPASLYRSIGVKP